MFRRNHAATGVTEDAQGYDVTSHQTLGVDGYVPFPVIADFQQVGEYRLPLASIFKRNNPGMLRHDGVEDLSSSPNVYMPQWSAPSNGRSVNQTGGLVVNPMNSFDAGQQQANTFSANADQATVIAQFLNSRSPRYASMSALSGD
jgi:hypothetical protein